MQRTEDKQRVWARMLSEKKFEEEEKTRRSRGRGASQACEIVSKQIPASYQIQYRAKRRDYLDDRKVRQGMKLVETSPRGEQSGCVRQQ